MDIGQGLLALVGGAILGGLYFGALWLTVRQLPTTVWPVRLFIGSYLGRLAIALIGFFLIMQGDWQRAIAGLVGFVLARVALTAYLGPARSSDAPTT